MKAPRHRFSVRAFTLVEMLVGLTIMGLVMAGVLTFYYYTSLNFYISEQRLLINGNMRNFAETMMSNARNSNFVILYESFFDKGYRTANNAFPYTGVGDNSSLVGFDRDGSGKLDQSDRLSNKNAGDYIVFVFYTNPFYGWDPPVFSTPAPQPEIKRIIAYWIAPNRIYDGSNGQPPETAMYMVDTNDYPSGVTPWGVTFPVVFDKTKTTNDIESLLPPYDGTMASAQGKWGTDQSQWAKIVLNDVRGEIQTPGVPASNRGLNFEYLAGFDANNHVTNTAVLMNTRVLHGNSAKHVTNTFNFTLSPQG